MQILQLDHKSKTVVLKKDLVIKNDMVYEFFDRLPQEKREDALKKAVYIGVLALIEDRIAAFLADTKNQLGTELERLKILFELKTQFFTQSAVKGKVAERELVGVLNDYFDERELKDYAILIGDNQGKYKNVKTGDIMCFVDGREDLPVVVEVKFQKMLPLGDISERELKNNTNNIWGQLIEAKANREAKEAIIVFDEGIAPRIADSFGPVTYIPNVGFIAVINTQEGDYLPLFATYSIVRSMILAERPLMSNNALLQKIFGKVLVEVKKTLDLRKDIEANIRNNQKILDKLETMLKDLEITEGYLMKLLEGEDIDQDMLYRFFMGRKVQEESGR